MVQKLGLVLFFMISQASCARGEDAKIRSDHFDGTHFHNLNKTAEKSLMDVLKWRFSRSAAEETELVTTVTLATPAQRNDGNEIAVTFVGHSTFLLQANGMNVLTDPIWSTRCSPVSFIGPKRLKDPGIRFNDLPKIDVVVISHNHYDHLDVPTLEKLWQRDRPVFIVPLKNREVLTNAGIGHIVEHDWWESTSFSRGVTVTAVPAQHWSGRYILDRNQALWAGFVIRFGEKNVYFAGDTGFSDHFQTIKEHFGDFDIALIPIGAYLPLWFMRDSHLSPADAIKASGIIQARHTIPMHFGTFALGDDGFTLAERELRALMQEAKLPFTILAVGDTHHTQTTIASGSKP